MEIRLEAALIGLLDGIPEPYLLVDQSGRVRFANRGAVEQFGALVEPTSRATVDAIINALDPAANARVLAALHDGASLSVQLEAEQRGPAFASIDTWPVAGGSGVRFNPGRPGENAAEEGVGDARFTLFFESGPLPMWIFDPETLQILEVNRAAIAHYGFTREQFLTRTLPELQPSDAPLPESGKPEIPTSLAPISWGVITQPTSDGGVVDAEIAVQPSVYRGGKVMIALAHDLTEQKMVAEALASSQAELSAIVKAMGDVVLVVDGEGCFHDIAPTAAPLTPRAMRYLGRRLHDIVPSEAADAIIAAVRLALDRQTTEYAQYQLDLGEGEIIWLSGSFAPMSDSLVVWVARDITALKRYEEVLADAKREADEANRAKSDFLSRMSHELRTPLNSVLGYGQLLRMELDDPEQRDSVEQILSAGTHLLGLITEVLDIARIESGNLSLSKEPVQLSAVVDESLALLRPIAEETGVDFPPALRTDQFPHVMADRQRLKQVIVNLLSNAVKYNRPGGNVTLLCESRPGERIRITVSDAGPGIPADRMERLFTAFDRLGADASQIEGTGLGLAVSKALVEAMGGEIGAVSEVGKGSDFWFELDAAPDPFHAVRDGSPMPMDAPVLPARRRILYIGDDLSNLKLMQRILAHRPEVELLPGAGGASIVEMPDLPDVDLMLLDINLPEVRAIDVLERLKADPRTRSLPVVVLTAEASARESRRLRKLGADEVVTKPYDIEDLLSLVDAVGGRDGRTGHPR